MAIGDFYRVTLEGRFQLQQTINVFHYSAGEGIIMSDPPTFISNFIGAILPDVVAMISSQWTAFSVRVQDEDPAGLDYADLAPAFAGAVSSSDDLPPFACWSFLMQRTSKTTFNGHKRFCGVPEAWQTNGVITTGHSAAVAAAEYVLSQPVSDGVDTFDAVIMSRYLNGSLRASPVGNPIRAAIFKGITTQNSRKYGRGA